MASAEYFVTLETVRMPAIASARPRTIPVAAAAPPRPVRGRSRSQPRCRRDPSMYYPCPSLSPSRRPRLATRASVSTGRPRRRATVRVAVRKQVLVAQRAVVDVEAQVDKALPPARVAVLVGRRSPRRDEGGQKATAGHRSPLAQLPGCSPLLLPPRLSCSLLSNGCCSPTTKITFLEIPCGYHATLSSSRSCSW